MIEIILFVLAYLISLWYLIKWFEKSTYKIKI